MNSKNLKRSYNSLINNPLLASVVIFFTLSFFIGLISIPFYADGSSNLVENLIAEAHGTLFDLLIIGILILWFNKSSEKKKTISDSLAEIEDFRDWKAEEAKYRVLGHIRKLNNYKITNIPLHHYLLNDINIARLDLTGSQLSHVVLSGSKIQDVNFGMSNMHQAEFLKTNLTDVSFSESVLTGAKFTGANIFKCRFSESNLLLADFSSARLIDVNFDNADITGVNFEGAEIINCSFENAVGFDKEVLSKTKNFLEKKEPSKKASNLPYSITNAQIDFKQIIGNLKA